MGMTVDEAKMILNVEKIDAESKQSISSRRYKININHEIKHKDTGIQF